MVYSTQMPALLIYAHHASAASKLDRPVRNCRQTKSAATTRKKKLQKTALCVAEYAVELNGDELVECKDNGRVSCHPAQPRCRSLVQPVQPVNVQSGQRTIQVHLLSGRTNMERNDLLEDRASRRLKRFNKF